MNVYVATPPQSWCGRSSSPPTPWFQPGSSPADKVRLKRLRRKSLLLPNRGALRGIKPVTLRSVFCSALRHVFSNRRTLHSNFPPDSHASPAWESQERPASVLVPSAIRRCTSELSGCRCSRVRPDVSLGKAFDGRSALRPRPVPMLPEQGRASRAGKCRVGPRGQLALDQIAIGPSTPTLVSTIDLSTPGRHIPLTFDYGGKSRKPLSRRSPGAAVHRSTTL